MKITFDWEQKYIYEWRAGKTVTYTSKYHNIEILKEVNFQKTKGVYIEKKIKYYSICSKTVFNDIQDLLLFLRKKYKFYRRIKK